MPMEAFLELEVGPGFDVGRAAEGSGQG
jgi:hypothetical protein